MHRGALDNSTNNCTDKDTYTPSIAISNETDRWSRDHMTDRETCRHNSQRCTTRLQRLYVLFKRKRHVISRLSIVPRWYSLEARHHTK
jgi:hypothetical protein